MYNPYLNQYYGTQQMNRPQPMEMPMQTQKDSRANRLRTSNIVFNFILCYIINGVYNTQKSSDDEFLADTSL